MMGLKGILSLLLLLSVAFHGILGLFNSEGSDLDNDASLYDIRAYLTDNGAFDGEEGGEILDQEPYGFIVESIYRDINIFASSTTQVNVADFGAKGDGSDATEVTSKLASNNLAARSMKCIEKAWEKVCSASSSSSSVLVVPSNNKYLLKPVTFSGPCKSNVSVMISGTIEASSDRSDWNGTNGRYWILFDGIDNLQVGGGGTIDGNGQIWWKNSCKVNKTLPCKDAPTGITFNACNGLLVENLRVRNSQQIQVQFEKCTNVTASRLSISAPEKSPNTDGIHITRTQNIQIQNCIIATGDDCISVVSGSHNVKAANITCGPGHGISIGSLGAHNTEAHVSNVTVDTARFKGTSNGVRIKTWQGGSGEAKHLQFQNIYMSNVHNPIIIDQYYCDSKKQCTDKKSAVQISDVKYENISGTSASQVAISLKCSKNFPCKDIVVQEINLVKQGGRPAKSACQNVQWTQIGSVVPLPCPDNDTDITMDGISEL